MNKINFTKFTSLLEKQLDDFFINPSKNSWLYLPQISIYLRKSKRNIANQLLTNCLDIATIEVNEKFQNQKVASNTIKLIEQKAILLKKFDYIYVENVMNEHLLNHLKKNQFTVLENNHNEFSSCLIKKII